MTLHHQQLFSLDGLHESDLFINSSQTLKQQRDDDDCANIVDVIPENNDNQPNHDSSVHGELEDMDLIDMFLDENPEEVFGLKDIEPNDEIDIFEHGLGNVDEEQLITIVETVLQSPSLGVSLGSHFFSDDDGRSSHNATQSLITTTTLNTPITNGGFQTASGRVLEKPSEASIKKVVQMFANDSNDSQSTSSTNPLPCQSIDGCGGGGGFMTAKGAALTTPSEAALRRAEGLFLSSQHELDDLVNTFTSASGKRISAPTKQAMEQAKRVLLSSQPDQITTFLSASGKAVRAPNKESVQEATKKLHQEDSHAKEGGAIHTPTQRKTKLSKQLFTDNDTPQTIEKGGAAAVAASPSFNPFESVSSRRQQRASMSNNCLHRQILSSAEHENRKAQEGMSDAKKPLANPKGRLSDINTSTRFKTPAKEQGHPLAITPLPVEKKEAMRGEGVDPHTGISTASSFNRAPQAVSIFKFVGDDDLDGRRSLGEYFDKIPKPDLGKLSTTILQMDAQKALDYCDDASLHLLRDRLVAIGANERLATLGWIRNHVRWIVWKICSLIRSFITYPSEMLCLDEIHRQLCYRYEREVNQCQRSCLKKIVERDDVAGKFMVLVIVRIDSDSSPGSSSSPYSLYLSDGWYAIKADLEGDWWSLLIQKKLLYPGQKIGICGARLHSDDAMDILDSMDEKTQGDNIASLGHSLPRLVIGYNNVKRVAWDRTLGYQRSVCFRRPLRQIDPRGGLVPCIEAVIVRVYPMCWVERTSQGQRIIRPQRIHEQWLYRQQDDRYRNSINAPLPNKKGDAEEPCGSEFSRFLRVLLIDSHNPPHPDTHQSTMCQFTFWNVDERTLELCKPGARLEIFLCRPLSWSLAGPSIIGQNNAQTINTTLMCSLCSTKGTVIRLKQNTSATTINASTTGHHLYTSLIRPIEEGDCLTLNQDYDLPPQTTFSIKYQSNKLWLCLHGKQLACLMVPERLSGLLSLPSFSSNSNKTHPLDDGVMGKAIVVKDVTFLYEDPRFGFPVFILNDRSVVTFYSKEKREGRDDYKKEHSSIIDTAILDRLYEQLESILK